MMKEGQCIGKFMRKVGAAPNIETKKRLTSYLINLEYQPHWNDLETSHPVISI